MAFVDNRESGARGRQTEAALRRSQATAQALLESASEGILIVDAGGRIVVANRAAEAMFGYTLGELLGQPVEALLPESARQAHGGHRAGYFAAPRVRPMGRGLNLAGRRRDGTEFPVEISLSFVREGDGVLAMAFVSDITERKRMEQELQRQREALHQTEKLASLGTLAAGLAHEINNPIGIISSRIELMLTASDAEPLPVEVRDDLEVLQRNVRRVGQIANGLLSFARQAPRERQSVDLNRVVADTLSLVSSSMARSGIRVTTVIEPALPHLLGDAGALQQVLLNLLANAREALEGPGEVRVTTRRGPEPPASLQLVIADNGPGMPPEVRSRIFDPFFTTKRQGTGLGLAVSYGIVEDHRGRVEVESAPGQGTTFTLTFPALPGP